MSQIKEWIIDVLAPIPSEILAFFIKIAALLSYVLLGIIGIIGEKLMTGKKIKDLRVLGAIMVSVFVGYLSAVWCMSNMPEKAKYIVPLCTVSSEKIFIIITAWIEKKVRKQFED